MLVIASASELLNLSLYGKIYVATNEIRVSTSMVDTPTPEADTPEPSILVAKYDNNIDAGYAHFKLFSSFLKGDRVWNPKCVKRVSFLWEKLQKSFNEMQKDANGSKLEEMNDVVALIRESEISAFDLYQITIGYKAYMRHNDYPSGDRLENAKNTVEKKLREDFGIKDDIKPEPLIINWESN